MPSRLTPRFRAHRLPKKVMSRRSNPDLSSRGVSETVGVLAMAITRVLRSRDSSRLWPKVTEGSTARQYSSLKRAGITTAPLPQAAKLTSGAAATSASLDSKKTSSSKISAAASPSSRQHSTFPIKELSSLLLEKCTHYSLPSLPRSVKIQSSSFIVADGTALVN